MAIAEHAVDGTLSNCWTGELTLTDEHKELMQRAYEDVLGAKRSKRRIQKARRRRGTYTFVINYEEGCDVLDVRHYFKKYRASRIVLDHNDTPEMFAQLKQQLEHSLELVAARLDLIIAAPVEGQNYNGEPYLTYKVTY